MSGEAPRTLSAVRHQRQGPALACEGSSAPYGRLLLGTGPGMDAILAVPSVCTAHTTLLVLSAFVDAPAELNVVVRWSRGASSGPNILCEQRTHVDKGRG